MNHFFICLALFSFPLKMYSQETQKVEPAFGIFSKYPNVRDLTISSSGDEAYFTIQSPLEEISIIASIKKRNGIWLEPEMIDFSGRHRDLEPFLSPNNLKLYFASNRPLHDSFSESKDFDIWYVERENLNAEWSKPLNIGQPINTEHNEFYPSVSSNNNLYFTTDASASKGKDDIFFSAWNSNHYEVPVSLSNSINSEGYEFNAFIAPDESYLIYSGYNRKDGLGSGDLYISYQNEDKSWSTSKNLGEKINSKSMDYCPFVNMESSTLYFTSRRSSINKDRFNTIKDFVSAINKYENGFSRIYKTSFKKN